MIEQSTYFKLKGRLGNWLFEYAAALSRGRGACIGVWAETYYNKLKPRYLPMLPELVAVDAVPDGLEIYKQPRFGYVPLPETGDVCLDGEFQSEKYFDKELVREKIKIPVATLKNVAARYKEWLARPNVTSIHVRRGDYMKHPDQYPFVGRSYYISALSKLPECRDFIVCSDDISWCKRFFGTKFKGVRFLYSERNSEIEDLALMSMCKNHIISNSSFAWWGAWLNENPFKRVFAPSMWFGFSFKDDWSDIYAGGTEIIKNKYEPLLFLRACCVSFWWHFKLGYVILRRKAIGR